MEYNPHNHHRRSIRLKGYDYSRAGLYFITICTQDRAHLFGYIKNGKMILNAAGEMVARWYGELDHKFPFIRCHEMVVMPNHFHCILEIVDPVGADLRVCPSANNAGSIVHSGNPMGSHDRRENEHVGTGENTPSGERGEHVAADGNAGGDARDVRDENTDGEHIERGEHVGSPNNTDGEHIERGEHVGSPLHVVLQWFKTMTTNEYIRGVKTLGWKRFNGKLWQRNYWEHIIRNEQSYQKIAQYIRDNPQNRETDRPIKKRR